MLWIATGQVEQIGVCGQRLILFGVEEANLTHPAKQVEVLRIYKGKRLGIVRHGDTPSTGTGEREGILVGGSLLHRLSKQPIEGYMLL